MKDTLLIIQTLKALPARVGEGHLKPLIPLVLIARVLVILMVIKIMTLKSLGFKCSTLDRLQRFPSQCLLLRVLVVTSKSRETGGPGPESSKASGGRAWGGPRDVPEALGLQHTPRARGPVSLGLPATLSSWLNWL